MPDYHLPITITVPEGETLSSNHMFDALEAILAKAAADPASVLGLVRATPVEEQGNWIIRSIESPGVVMNPDRQWVTLNGAAPAENMLYERDAGYGIALGDDQVWCRSDLVYDPIVSGTVYSDDRVINLTVDVRPFLETATKDDIETLATEDWCFSESADAVAYTLEGLGDPGAGRLFWYLGMKPGGVGKEQVGFSVEVDGSEALAWLKEHRPELHAELDIEEPFQLTF